MKRARPGLASWIRRKSPDGVAILSSSTPLGAPSSRAVLHLGFLEGRLAFLADPASRKGRELAANPRAALLFYSGSARGRWPLSAEQLRVEGRVKRLNFHGMGLFLLYPTRVEFWEGKVPGPSRRQIWTLKGSQWTSKTIIFKPFSDFPRLPNPLKYPFEK